LSGSWLRCSRKTTCSPSDTLRQLRSSYMCRGAGGRTLMRSGCSPSASRSGE
jgi:hypothetical protein